MTTEPPEHRHLRSALEFAVEIARAGQKLRPPLPVPPGIGKFVKMQRVPSGTLGQLRRVIEQDPVFRQRLAAAATPELVDEIGLVWLQRPEEWETRIEELVAQARAETEQATAQTVLRREERRREAAEQAAVRARVEITALQDRVEELMGELDQHRSRSSARDAEVAQLRSELIQARNQARHAQDRATAAAAKLERVETERRTESAGQVSREPAVRPDRLAADQHADDKPAAPELATRGLVAQTQAADKRAADKRAADKRAAGKRAADKRAAETMVSDRLVALTASARRFAEQLEELRAFHEADLAEPSPTPAGPAPRTESAVPRRRPLALPGGVSGSSKIAAQHVLGADATILVDGYNVSMLGWPGLPLALQRAALVDAAESMAQRTGADVTVVFDGADVVVQAADQRRVVRVVYSPPEVSADDVIRSEVHRLPASRAVVVVTNDGEIRRDVRALGANLVSSDHFLSLLRR